MEGGDIGRGIEEQGERDGEREREKREREINGREEESSRERISAYWCGRTEWKDD